MHFAPLLALAVIFQVAPDAEIGARIAARQNADGGFAAGDGGGESSLGATNTSIRVLGFLGGSIPDPLKAIAYIKSCQDERTGGFAPKPGGEPGVGVTASGLMALGELNAATPEIVDKAVAYLDANAKTYEEVRIAVAGLEAVKAKAPGAEGWKALLMEGRNADGTWGEGAKAAFDTGGRAAGLLRLGIDLDHRGAIAKSLIEAQGEDGGWSQDGKASDLSTTYRITRALYMMGERPDVERLKSFVESCRHENGLYGGAAGREGDLGGTYMALIVRRWARMLGGEPGRVETAGFRPLLEGNSLEGWEGDTAPWSVKDGVIVGDSEGLNHNTFLSAPGTYGNFDLKFTFRLKDGKGNSGVQFRSVPVPPHEMSGYQADIGEAYWGSLYDESRRNKVLAQASEKAAAAVRADGWNTYRVRAQGPKIEMYLNDIPSVNYTEMDSGIAETGKIAVQIHSGPAMRIEFKDMMIQRLPEPTTDDLDKPGFHLRELKIGDSTRKYGVFVPEGYDGSKPVPVVLFLHGSGERGEDGMAPMIVGLGGAITQEPSAFPFIAVFPQARETWRAGSPDADAALAALAEVEKEYRTDPKRVYLTGLSMGGMGTWTIAAADPKRWAAIAPVCGYAPVEVVESLKKTPTWTIIGDADMPRLLGSTRELAAGLQAAGAPVKYTEYREIGHNSWDRAYNDRELVKWLLSNSRAE